MTPNNQNKRYIALNVSCFIVSPTDPRNVKFLRTPEFRSELLSSIISQYDCEDKRALVNKINVLHRLSESSENGSITSRWYSGLYNPLEDQLSNKESKTNAEGNNQFCNVFVDIPSELVRHLEDADVFNLKMFGLPIRLIAYNSRKKVLIPKFKATCGITGSYYGDKAVDAVLNPYKFTPPKKAFNSIRVQLIHGINDALTKMGSELYVIGDTYRFNEKDVTWDINLEAVYGDASTLRDTLAQLKGEIKVRNRELEYEVVDPLPRNSESISVKVEEENEDISFEEEEKPKPKSRSLSRSPEKEKPKEIMESPPKITIRTRAQEVKSPSEAETKSWIGLFTSTPISTPPRSNTPTSRDLRSRQPPTMRDTLTVDVKIPVEEKLKKVIGIKSSPTASKDDTKPPLQTHMLIPSSTTPITTPRAADMKMLESNTKLTQENESLKKKIADLENQIEMNEKAHTDALIHASEFKVQTLNKRIDTLTVKNKELEAELANLNEESNRRVGMARQVHDEAQSDEIARLNHELHGTKAMLGQLYGTFMNVFGHMIRPQDVYQPHGEFHPEVHQDMPEDNEFHDTEELIA